MKRVFLIVTTFTILASSMATARIEREGILVDIADLGGGAISTDDEKPQTRIEREGSLVDIADLGGGEASEAATQADD